MQAIVVTFDRLATRLLGCYGNEWIETPHFDQLASIATVFDSHFTDTVGPRRGWAWMTGVHALQRAQVGYPAGAWLQEAEITTRAVVAERGARERFRQSGFDHCHFVDAAEGLDVPPQDVAFARLAQAGIATLNDPAFQSDRRLLWLHAPEPGTPPEGFATLYFEDFEERGAPVSEVREAWDRELAVAAGSLSLVDHWLGVLLEKLRAEDSHRPTLIVIAAAGGGAWMDDFVAASPAIAAGSPVSKLRNQEIQAPLILAVWNDERSKVLSSIRCPHFVQPMDLLPTLANWFDPRKPWDRWPGQSLLNIPINSRSSREAVIFGDEDCCFGIRTRQWNCLARTGTPDQRLVDSDPSNELDWPEQVQLYTTPDDIWNVTDVSTQYPDVCHQLLLRLDAIRQGEAASLSQ